MLKWLRNHFHREMTRALVYKLFTRGLLALFAAQLIHFFVPGNSPVKSFSNLSLLFALLFALFSVLAWLRLDGLRIPQLKLPRLRRKNPPFLNGDIADHMDDDIILFDDLDEGDQNVCVLLADIILTAGCLILAGILSL